MADTADVEDVESRLAATLAKQRSQLETLGTVAALALVGSAAWYVWPGVEGTVPLIPRLGPAIVLLLCALAMQDLVDFGPRHRSRLGAAMAIAWPPLLLLGIRAFEDTGWVQLGNLLMLPLAVAAFEFSRVQLSGGIQALRYRGLMGATGGMVALSLVISEGAESELMMSGLLVVALALIRAGMDVFGSDKERPERRRFKEQRDALEKRVLELRAQDIKIDQAASLLQAATKVGWNDPKEGLSLLATAADDIERTLALSSDIADILADAVAAVEQSEEVAPESKRPRNCITLGEREMELGSLRDAEQLFRQGKKRAADIIEWWTPAEDAISVGMRALDGCAGEQYEPVRRMLQEAQDALEREEAAEAAELASAIPQHVEAMGEAGEGAEESLEEARRALEQAKGIDQDVFNDRIEQAAAALEAGQYSMARGLSDSVLREVSREREAMVEVQKALRQQKKLRARWEGRDDADDWENRLEGIKGARKEKQWSHAATLLERLTNDLDATQAAHGEATELLDFLQGEWRALRNQLESNGIKVDDAERHACEGTIGGAVASLGSGDVEACLAKLGEADTQMEALRRRI